MPTNRPTAVVVDDDELARERLKDLNAESGLVEVVGEAADGAAGVELIEAKRPELAFLDIEMPGFSGLHIVDRLTYRPIVIFTTAYPQYAARAFELAAIDYLLKPFGLERFEESVGRAIAAGPLRGVDQLDHARSVLEPDGGAPERIFVRERQEILPIQVTAIVRFEADGDYVRVFVGGKVHLVRMNLQDLEECLGEGFMRVHRSHLVNLAHVQRFEPHDASRLAVILKDGSKVVASRARSQELRRLAR